MNYVKMDEKKGKESLVKTLWKKEEYCQGWNRKYKIVIKQWHVIYVINV